MATDLDTRRAEGRIGSPEVVLAPAHEPAADALAERRVPADGLRASAVLTAALLPGLAATVSVALYIAQDQWVGWLNDGGPRAYLVGSAVGLIAWLLLAVAARGIATPAGGNPSAYGQLCEMLADLEANHRSLEGEAVNASGRTALAVAGEHLHYMRACLEGDRLPGQAWAFGSGYIGLWRRAHRVEEELLMVRPRATVIGAAVHDMLRLTGSTIPKRERLLAELVEAMSAIDPRATATYLGAEQSRVRGRAPARGSELGPRAVLIAVRRSINDFRDQRRAGLVRARNHLLATMAATGLVTYVFLGIAFLMQAPVSAIVAFSAFYLTGAVVGLFRQLQAASTRYAVAEDDFGLSYARLMHAPLFSGLAAVAGVMLTALASQLMLANGTTGATSGLKIPSLDQVFSLSTNQGGLVFAAMFGLVPNLFIARLQLRAESYKDDLRSSETAEHSGTDTEAV
ncbi:MAG TPA: hypothetical protein VFW14_20310 [Gaiellales bacterium]|nr:hypothetical protein [Gaiellales bacterium]